MTTQGEVRTNEGRLLSFQERGGPGDPVVVFHHGTPGSRLDKHPDPAASAGVRLISYDRPGYGRSDPQPGRSVASAAEDVRAIADALGIERFGVFGVSGGGPHALACAALLPDRVSRAAVVVGAAPSDDPSFDFMIGMNDANLREFGLAAESPEALEAELSRLAGEAARDPDAFMDTLAADLPEPDRDVLARPEVRAMLRDSFVEAVRQGTHGWLDDDLAFVAPWGFDLGDVRAEVRLWQGEVDLLVPRSHMDYLAAHLPRATSELVPGAGHFILDEWPLAFAWLAGS